MSLPNNALFPDGLASILLDPDDAGRTIPTEDYELGGIGLSDPSQGLQVQIWRLRLVGQEVRVSPFPYTAETALFTGTDITELSLAFDQNMRPTIAYIDAGVPKLYWYDPVAGSNVTTGLATDIVSVFVTMDDKRSAATLGNINDILLFYNRGGILYYRQQRERYNTERMLAILKAPTGRLKKAGMNVGWRVQIEAVY